MKQRIEGCGLFRDLAIATTRTLRYGLHYALRLRSGRSFGLLRMLVVSHVEPLILPLQLLSCSYCPKIKREVIS